MQIKIEIPDIPELKQAAQDLRDDLPMIAATTAVGFYQQSFNSQGMYGKPRWKKRRNAADAGRNVLIGKGSGALRRSIRYRHYSDGEGKTVEVFTDQDHAKVHNEGGTFVPSPKQRKFFWAMHYQAADAGAQAAPKRSKKGKIAKPSQRYNKLSEEAEMWLNMALAKKITMPRRQFMDIQAEGMSDSLKRFIELKVKKMVDEAMK